MKSDFSNFDISNGMSGMMRDLIFRLCHLVEMQPNETSKDKDLRIRTLIGMCREHVIWKNHSFFIKNRFRCSYISVPLQQTNTTYTVTQTVRGEHCFLWAPSTYTTVFLDREIAEEVFQWTIKIEYGKKNSFLYLGTAHSSVISNCRDSVLGAVRGTCSFRFYRIPNGLYRSGLGGVISFHDVPDMETSVPDNSLVAIEIDIDADTLSFFVNGKKVPRVITRIQSPLYAGVSGCDQPSFTSISFRRLLRTTPSTVECKTYACL